MNQFSNKNYFTMPNEIFSLGLDASEIAVYAYLRCLENRRTYQCWPSYYDSIWFVTRTRHSRSNLLNRIFITRGRRTVYSSSAWLIKETVHPLPSHYNKNKHSLRGFLYASGAMLILYQTKSTTTHLLSAYSKKCHKFRWLHTVIFFAAVDKLINSVRAITSLPQVFYLCTLPVPSPPMSFVTSETFTRLKSPMTECFRQLAATANSSADCLSS